MAVVDLPDASKLDGLGRLYRGVGGFPSVVALVLIGFGCFGAYAFAQYWAGVERARAAAVQDELDKRDARLERLEERADEDRREFRDCLKTHCQQSTEAVNLVRTALDNNSAAFDRFGDQVGELASQVGDLSDQIQTLRRTPAQ